MPYIDAKPRSSDEAHRCIAGPGVFFGRSPLHRHPVRVCADTERRSSIDGPLPLHRSELLIPLELLIHLPLFTLPPFRNVPGKIMLPGMHCVPVLLLFQCAYQARLLRPASLWLRLTYSTCDVPFLIITPLTCDMNGL